jgi:hypothetical protein
MKNWIGKVFMIAAVAFISTEMVEGRDYIGFWNGQMFKLERDADGQHFNVLNSHGQLISNEHSGPIKVKVENEEIVTVFPEDKNILDEKLGGGTERRSVSANKFGKSIGSAKKGIGSLGAALAPRQ